jgi:hypothetical protein
VLLQRVSSGCLALAGSDRGGRRRRNNKGRATGSSLALLSLSLGLLR